METDILPIDPTKLGHLSSSPATEEGLVEEWDIAYNELGEDMKRLQRAAQEIATTDVPVAFPTETVYGLGADATRSSAVRAIFAAKGRPADNPLIVHIHSISQLRSLLRGSKDAPTNPTDANEDPIPPIYKPLIRKFWPGPLTIILPNPPTSILAPEVTAGLDTFGARMPRSILALALIRLAGAPLAAPSANASTRPSPTAAEHVKDDLNGRIHTILDGGPCEVGVESTVVDGLSSPPAILRPGGITVEQLRQCPGWEKLVVGYKDVAENGGAAKPRAPGMKYRHYSPKATVFLYEVGKGERDRESFLERVEGYKCVGVIRTKTWARGLGLPVRETVQNGVNGSSRPVHASLSNGNAVPVPESNLLRSFVQHQVPHAEQLTVEMGSAILDVWDIHLGAETEDVARGLFSALRELDKKGAEAIYVEGIDDKDGDDIAAAVMNRLRKAAQVQI